MVKVCGTSGFGVVRLLDVSQLITQPVIQRQGLTDTELILNKERIILCSEIKYGITETLAVALPQLARAMPRIIESKRVEIAIAIGAIAVTQDVQIILSADDVDAQS